MSVLLFLIKGKIIILGAKNNLTYMYANFYSDYSEAKFWLEKLLVVAMNQQRKY